MKNQLNSKTLVALGLTCAMAIGSLNAAPTEELDGGNTVVTLSATFVNALGSLTVGLADINPARVKKGKATFPVKSGAIDLDTLAGEIVHEGGLKLSAGSTTVELIDFVIDTTKPDIVLTGLVIANDSVVGRIPLFSVTLTQDAEETRNAVKIAGANLKLTSEAAGALNSVFSVKAFTAGLDVGVAAIDAKKD